jgi:hypothetical protein
MEPRRLPYASVPVSHLRNTRTLSNASWVIAVCASILTAFWPLDILEAFYLRVGCSTFAFALGFSLGTVALVFSRGGSKSAWFSCGANLLGLLLSAAYYFMLFRRYRAQGWL